MTASGTAGMTLNNPNLSAQPEASYRAEALMQISDELAQQNVHRCTCPNDGDSIRPQYHAVGCEYAVWYYQLRDTPPERRRGPVPAIVALDQDAALCSCLERIGDDPRCPVHGINHHA